MNTLSDSELQRYFPFLCKENTEHLRKEFLSAATVQCLQTDQIVCWEGDLCSHLAIVLDGSVRVFKVGENGREITLYRIEEADSCILTASCILSQTRFPALATVELPVRAVLIPAATVRDWVSCSTDWQAYLFQIMSTRLSTVIATIDQVIFRRIDERIVDFLVSKTKKQASFKITHQEIASELGTAREVVSRILKDLERSKKIALSRGAIRVIDLQPSRTQEVTHRR